MKLNWSHAVINVQDMNIMLDFYTNVMGFTISDRGPLNVPNVNDGLDDSEIPEIVFMSQRYDEHHQFAMVEAVEKCPTTSINHLSFRVDTYADLKEGIRRLQSRQVDF